jgi:opacity protein-like surface antigen
MKKILLAAAVLCVGITAINAQKVSQENNFKVNILSPIVRTGSVFYERKLGESTTGQLGFFYTGYSIDNLKLRGFGITPEFRYYASPDKGAMNGFYLAPFARYQNYTLTEDANKGTFSSIGGGLLIGNQWMLKGGINIDLFIGPSISTGSIKVKSGTDNFDLPFGLEGFGVRSGLTVGIAF